MEHWKKLGETYAYRGWRSILRRHFLLPDQQSASFDILDALDYVTVAPLTREGKFLIIKQFRPGPETVLLSFPEGAIDPGETPESSAARELAEETGYLAGDLHYLRTFRNSYTVQHQHCFLAIDCEPGQSHLSDPHEFIELQPIDPSDLKTLMLDPNGPPFSNVGCGFLALAKLGLL